MAESAGLNVVVGTQRRNSPDYLSTFEMIQNGAIGDLISANCYWNTGALWHVPRQEGWTDMEAMLRAWVNWTWLSGDHIVEQHVHNIDVINTHNNGYFSCKHKFCIIKISKIYAYSRKHFVLT